MSRFVLPRESTFDINGLPQSGATLDFYEVGTTTRKDTFSDEALTTPNANPVVADANGTFPNIWLSGDYDAVLKNSGGVTVWGPEKVEQFVTESSDKYSPSTVNEMINDARFSQADIGGNPATTKEFSTGNGGGGVYDAVLTSSVTPPPTGSTIGNNIITSVADPSISFVLRVVQPIDPRTFGAVWDGTTNDRAALQAVFDYQNLGKFNGGQIWPEGAVRIEGEPLELFSGMRITGSGNNDVWYGTKTGNENPTLIFNATAGKAVFKWGQGLNEMVLERFIISDVAAPVAFSLPTSGNNGIDMIGSAPFSSYRNELKEISFYNFDKAINVEGTGDWQNDDLLLYQCQWWNNTTGVRFNTTNADAWTFINCTSTVAENGSWLHCIRSGYLQIIGGYSAPSPLSGGGFVTGTSAFLLGDFPDNILWQGHQVEFMDYFLHVDTSTGFENNYRTYTLDNCIVESPCLIERQCTIVSNQSRYARPVSCTGDKIEVHSNQDTWETPASFGSHNGANNSATLSDSTANRGLGWATDRLVGKVITNHTDGSTGTITANTATTVTATLSGGTDNDWDSGDRYSIPAVDEFNMSGTNPNLHYSAGSIQTSGITTMATATTTTLFTLLDQEAMYKVIVYIQNTGDTNVAAEMTVITDGSGTAMTKNVDNSGTAITLSVSGLNVQCNQITGVSQNMAWKYYRMG